MLVNININKNNDFNDDNININKKTNESDDEYI